MSRRKRSKDEDADYDDYEVSGEDDNQSEVENKDDEDYDEDYDEAEMSGGGRKPQPAVTPSKSSVKSSNSTTRKKKKRRINYKDPEIDQMSSLERKTNAGGYAHTNRSKEKISKANAGNVPWNKGKKRSSADKAKIKAGVQARNRAIKLEKLRRLGLTEEEYDQKKKEIKYLRERVRRTKLANDRHNATQAQKKLQEALDATTDKGPKIILLTPAQVAKQARMEAAADQRQRIDKDIFLQTDFAWTKVDDGDSTYPKKCPRGGPGGLVCCVDCFSSYSSYLNKTVKDMEMQRTHKIGNEAKELLDILTFERGDLDKAVSVARRKSPPPRRLGTEPRLASTRRAASNSNAVNQRGDQQLLLKEWNLTSTIDIVNQTAFV